MITTPMNNPVTSACNMNDHARELEPVGWPRVESLYTEGYPEAIGEEIAEGIAEGRAEVYVVGIAEENVEGIVHGHSESHTER
jgi:hypothetical protein